MASLFFQFSLPPPPSNTHKRYPAYWPNFHILLISNFPQSALAAQD